MNTRCPPKRVPSAVCFFSHCRPTIQPPQSYSVGGQRSSGQLTGKPAALCHEEDQQGEWWPTAACSATDDWRKPPAAEKVAWKKELRKEILQELRNKIRDLDTEGEEEETPRH
ncbi:UNVERIFIED_CONTAM: hypothetical protein FKN15_028070 [Acipenser sinensis]